MLYLHKIIYILRKKIINLVLIYLKLESKALLKKRINLPGKMSIEKFPILVFDQSNSSLSIYENFSVRGKLRLLFNSNGKLEIGESVFFNNDCSINCLDNIKIGNNCLFGESVKIYDHNHLYKDYSRLIKDQGYVTAPVIIGDNCWIGSNVTILKGVNIGDGCIVGANSLIYKDIPSKTIVVSNANNNVYKEV